MEQEMILPTDEVMKPVEDEEREEIFEEEV